MSRTKNLSNDERNGVLQSLLLKLTGPHTLERGAVKEVAASFNVSPRTVSRIWAKYRSDRAAGKICADVSSRKKGSSGRKKIDYASNFALIKDVPFNKRGTFRSLSHAIGVPKSTLQRRLKTDKAIRRVSSSIKPFLTEDNKVARVRFCLSHVRPNGYFHDFYDTIHIDEKWFYLTQTQRSYYLLPEEEGPHRTCKSKRFITKIMFLAAVARPRWDPKKKQWFDGKLGLWPFVYQEQAKRNSKNRAKGTLVTKATEVINTAESRKMILEKVFPAIRERFPRGNKIVKIQQDNAKPHCSVNDPEVIKAGSTHGWNITLVCQPPNSPDTNVLDLGYFNAIQSLQHEASPTTVDELITAVNESFAKLSKETLDSVFLTLQACMESIMLTGGGNEYKIPHMKKSILRRQGGLQQSILCSPAAINAARSLLNDQS